MNDEVIIRDCLQAMISLPDQSVDHVLTDPPYPNYQGLFAEDVADGYAGLYLATKKARNLVIFFWSPRFPTPTPPPGWFVIAQHVWHKPDATANTRYEHIMVWSRERQRKTSKVFTVPILEFSTLRDWQPHPHKNRCDYCVSSLPSTRKKTRRSSTPSPAAAAPPSPACR